MQRFTPSVCLLVAFLAVVCPSTHSAGVPVYRAGAFSADNSDDTVAAVPVERQQETNVVEETKNTDYADYTNEGRGLSDNTALLNDFEEQDRAAFFNIVNKILWNHGTGVEHTDARGFSHEGQVRGLFRMDKPALLEADGLGARMYEQGVDQCYLGLCKLGLGGLFTSISDMLENFM